MSPESDCWLGAFSESTDLEGGVLLIADGLASSLLRDFDGVTGGDGTAFDDLAEHALAGHDAVAHLVVDGTVRWR